MDQGAVAPDYPMERMILALRSGADQASALDAFSTAQQDRQSPLYRHWLTPAIFGAHFGLSPHDLAAVVDWLRSYGFDVDSPPAGRRWLIFSGTAAQVEAAFHTSIHRYLVNGKLHHASDTTSDIPEALAAVVEGVVSLDDFRAAVGPHPRYGSTGSYLVAPYDFAAIYDSIPLYSNGSSLAGGLGVGIAIVGRSNINPADIAKLANTPNSFGITAALVMTPYGDPGVNCTQSDPDFSEEGCTDWLEATVDVTRAGSVAPQAQAVLVPVKSTNTTDGIQLSAQYIVDQNVAPIVSVSFSDCEPAMSRSAATLWSNLWSQAAAEGMSVIVASGDWGADECYPQREEGGTNYRGQAVNGLCSPPYAVCVGGTMFNDTSSPSSYWSNSGNALGYIPENVWNEVSGGVNFASGGGSSVLYSKPAWQQAVTPADGARDVPDVALSSAFHDAYLLYLGGNQTTGQGTSASAPSFAGIMALILASTGSDAAWGNPGPTLYQLQQADNASNLFHPTAGGNNTVPTATGFSATGAGYNLATGLGSVDTAVLASVWPSTTLSISSTHTGNFSQGQLGATYSVTVTTTTRPSTGPVTVTDTLPPGLTMAGMMGTGWTCSTTNTSGTCTSNASLNANSNYPIAVTVNVAGNAATALTNSVSVSGGGSLGASAQDVTVITLPAQTISFGALSTRLLGSGSFTLSATASSGLTVSFGSLTRHVCTVSGTTVALVNLGTCTIQASQNGNADYAPAPSVDQSFLVVSLCDLTQVGSVGIGDVQTMVNEALGTSSLTYDLNGDGVVNVVDVQIEIGAALGGTCFAAN
jgi:subtilase family serine protease